MLPDEAEPLEPVALLVLVEDVVDVGLAVVVVATVVVAGAGVEVVVAGAEPLPSNHSATPPWCEQVPGWVCEKL